MDPVQYPQQTEKLIPQRFQIIKYEKGQFPKYPTFQQFAQCPMFVSLKSPQSQQILKKIYQSKKWMSGPNGRTYMAARFHSQAQRLGYSQPYPTFEIQGQQKKPQQVHKMKRKTYNFEDAKYNIASYIELIRGDIAFQDFVNLVEASLNGIYLIDYGAWFDIATFPKLLYKVMNSMMPIQIKRPQDVNKLFANWVVGDVTINKTKQSIFKIKTVTDTTPQWLQIPVPEQFLLSTQRLSLKSAIQIEPVTLGSAIMAINCIYSLLDHQAFKLNFQEGFKIVYQYKNVPVQQLNDIWQKSAFDIKKTSFYFQNTQRKKYNVEKRISIENGNIIQIPLPYAKKDWQKDYEAIFQQSKKKTQNIQKYKQITQEMKKSQTIKFGQFSKFAVALQQVKQSQFQQIDKLIKQAFQSHMKSLQKCQHYQKNVQLYLEKSWTDLKTTIPLIKSIDDYQQFALSPVNFFIKHMILPLKVFDVQTIYKHFISALINFNKYIRVEGKALHSRYLKVGFEMNIEGQEYIPFDSQQVFLKKQDRSVYYMIGDKLTKKGDKVKLRFSEIKTIYTTIKKFLQEKQSKITIKMIHQRILLFLKNMGGDVQQVQQYFRDEKVNLSSKQLQSLAKKLIPKTQNKELQPE